MGSATHIASHKACTSAPLWGKVSFTIGSLLAEPTKAKNKSHEKILTAAQQIPGGQHVPKILQLWRQPPSRGHRVHSLHEWAHEGHTKVAGVAVQGVSQLY